MFFYKMIKMLGIWILFIASFSFLFSCSGSDSPWQTSSVTGVWEENREVTDDCGATPITQTKTDAISIFQPETGNAISVTLIAYNQTVSGTISGKDIQWSGTISDDDSQLSLSYSATIDESGDGMTGSGTWTWEDSTSSTTCTGNETIQANRIGNVTTDITGNWEGHGKKRIHPRMAHSVFPCSKRAAV